MTDLQQHFLVNQMIQTGSNHQISYVEDQKLITPKDTAVTFAFSSPSFQSIASSALYLLQI